MITERPRNCCTRLTEKEINDIKRVTGKATIEASLQDAVEYRIANTTTKKEKVN